MKDKELYRIFIVVIVSISIAIVGVISTQSKIEELKTDKIDRETSQTGIIIDDIAFGIYPKGYWKNDTISHNIVHNDSGEPSQIIREQIWKRKIKNDSNSIDNINNPVFSEFLQDFCKKNNTTVHKIKNNNYYSLIKDGDNVINVELKYYKRNDDNNEYISIKYIKPIILQ